MSDHEDLAALADAARLAASMRYLPFRTRRQEDALAAHDALVAERRGTARGYDIALRPHVDGYPRMDDIVVNNVSCFRAEDMTGKAWWVACYLPDGEEIVFWVTAKKKPLRLEWVVTERPTNVVYEEDS